MTKDWRLAVCTRWRPLATLILIIGFFFVGIGITFLVDVISPDIYDKAKSLAIGMTEQQLIEIMGSPAHTESVTTLQVVSRLPGFPQDFKDIVDAHERVIEYRYDERKFGSTGSLVIGGIYLDEERHTIVLLQPHIIEILDGFGIYEPFLLLVACSTLPLLGLWLWCKRSMKKMNEKGLEVPLP